MKMKTISFSLYLIVAFLFFYNPVVSQEYATANISEALLKNSNAVIREHSEEFTIISKKETRLKGKMVVTLLNEKAERWGYVVLPYDKFSKVEKIRATIYDESGKEEIKMKQSDLMDISAVSSFSIYEDNRIKAYNPSYKRYPYTLEYEYQYTFNGTLFYPRWDPQPDENIAVESSTFRIVTNPKLPFRYKTINVGKPDSGLVDGFWTYSWSLKNQPSIEEELFGEKISQRVPSVITAPYEFELDGYPGRMESWEDFAKWIIGLNKDKDKLDVQTEADLDNLIDPDDAPEVVVRKVYEYLQSKTRYVSIQLGIGGFQPFPASVVGEKGYGDCKALANYTKAMLSRLGIPSHYTLVRAGKDAPDLHLDFPSSQFNHAFLCVPLKKDTVWLECTSQTNPFGYLGTFTGGRNVLLITETGGKIVKTPSYKQNDNTQFRKAVVTLEGGNAFLNVTTEYRGLQIENDHMNFMTYESKEDQKKWLYKKLKLSNFKINNFAFGTIKEKIPTVSEKLDITITGYSSKNGKRIFFQPNILNRLSLQVPKYETRNSEIILKQPFIDIDTVEFNVTSNLYLDFLPEKTEIKNEFGHYRVEFIASADKVVYIRKFSLNEGKFPKEKYKEFSEFIRKVKNSDNLKLAFVDKT